MATVHLICGLPAAGKTTYSTRLSDLKTAVNFRLDHWLVTAYGKYAINTIGHEEHARRVFACRALIWDVAVEFLRREVDVILDDGFFLRAHRLHYMVMAQQVNADIAVHFINTPRAIIEARLEKRNLHLPPDSFSITPAMLDRFYALFEPPLAADGMPVIEIGRRDTD